MFHDRLKQHENVVQKAKANLVFGNYAKAKYHRCFDLLLGSAVRFQGMQSVSKSTKYIRLFFKCRNISIYEPFAFLEIVKPKQSN